jgi:RNA polymerase sigma-70 factor (ECF subfamily)
MAARPPDTDELVRRSAAGSDAARQELLVRHRGRLRRMISVRLDRRLLARIDPSDVVQEVLVEAHGKLDDYLRDQPIAFYPWLRQIAWQRLLKIHQHHHARKRGVAREGPPLPQLPDESAWALADRLRASGTSPSRHAVREELRQGVRRALDQLGERDREVLVLRYLEQMPLAEIAAVLGISEGAVKARHARALIRLQALLTGDREDE